MEQALQFEEAAILKPEAAPVCPCPWLENPYGLVSLFEMLTFDAGRLARAMQYLADNHRILEGHGFSGHLFIELVGQDLYVSNLGDIAQYCEGMSWSMTKITLDRILRLMNDPRFTVDAMSELLGEAARRLRDEAGIYTLLQVSVERSRFYNEPRAAWEEVIRRFPAAVSDIEEANICFALERYAACVFHCVQVVETGLIALGEFLGIKDQKSGWTATANELERITRKRYSDLTPFEVQHIGFLKQIQATVVALQDAWRNKISHAQGRLAVMTADFSPKVAEEILVASRGFMRRLATDLPSVGA